ncbi:MAG: LysE family translocator [Ignavibacteriae bacterium]|nr:MAG: LysE family translocator [Ignavibacteriota bacterium]
MSFNLFGYLVYASLMSITPGPNNLMLLSYGKAYGFNDSRNVMLGIFLGFFIMLCLAGYGIANIITRNPHAGLVLKIVGSLWMLYLAFVLRKISVEIEPGKKPAIGFGQAFSMQFVNLKAWIMAISGASAFLPQSNSIHLNVFVYAISFGLVGIPCMFIWLKMGDVIAKLFKSEKAGQVLGYAMFSLMIVSIVTIWIQ